MLLLQSLGGIPLGELFRERTLGTIAEVFEAKILINLQEGLVLPGVFQVGFGLGE